MSTTESVASLSSTPPSSATSSLPPSPRWVDDDCFDCSGVDCVRQALRGMEAELVDLVLGNSCAGRWMDWLRVPLECATANGRLDAVKRLLAAGVETALPPRRSSPGPLLHAAAASGSAGVISELLKAGADVDEIDKNRGDRTALHFAAGSGVEDAVLALVRAGAKVDAADVRGWTPLHVASKLGHRATVEFLLLKGANALRATIPEEDSPLHLAASNNHAGVIEDLVVLGNACVGCCNIHGQTALHVAARGCRLDACIALLRAGSAVGRVSSQGLSCLDLAAWNGHTGRLLQILTAGEPAPDRRRRCSLALYYAAKANKPRTIEDLVSLGANVDQRKSGGMTNLHYTASRGSNAAAEALLRAGADVQAVTNEGDTPLHRACMFSHASTVELLLRWGADEKVQNFSNMTPFNLAGIAGIVDTSSTGVSLQESAARRARDEVIREMLKNAPADRVWRRRSWLVLCRFRWMARVAAKQPPHLRRCATPLKKRLGKGSASVHACTRKGTSRSERCGVAQGKGKERRTQGNEGAVVLRLGRNSLLSDAGVRVDSGAGSEEEKSVFVSAVERLMMLREEGVFRDVITFL